MARLDSTLASTAKRVGALPVAGAKLAMEVGVLGLEVGAKRSRSAGAREEAEVGVGRMRGFTMCMCQDVANVL